MEISKTTRFNTCKKIAQLQRVITVFKTQIEDRRFQKSALGKIFDEKFAKLSEDYEKKIESDIKPKCDNQNEVESKYKSKYEQNIEKFKTQISEKTTNIQNGAEKILSELDNLMTQINAISQPLISKTKELVENYTKNADKVQKELSTKCKDMKSVCNKEIEEFIKNADEKENQFVIDSRKKFDEMRQKHQSDIDTIKNSKPMPKLSKKEIDNLTKHKNALKQMSEVYKKVHEDYNYLVNAHRMWIYQSREKFKDIMKIAKNSSSNVDPKTLQKARDDLQALLAKLSQELSDKQKKLELTQAELKFSYQKLKSEITELLEKENAEFLEKKNKILEESGELSKELAQLREQNKQELNALKEKYAEEENQLTQKENYAKSQIEVVSKPFKSEKQKIKKELTALKNSNKAERSKKENELNLIVENQINVYKNEENSFRDQLNSLKRGGNQQENENRKQLNQILQEKEKAMIEKTKKINEFDAQASDAIEKQRLQNKLNEESVSREYDDAYNSIKSKSDKKVDDLMQKIQEEERNLQDLMTNKYIVAINQIKQQFQNDFPPVQEDPEIIALKEQFTNQQNNLHSIKTPGTGNGEFALLNATVETLQNELNGQKLSIDKERESILNSWKKQIEEEEKRHKNIGEGPSTRGRDQLKHTLQSQIDGVIESRENDEKKLRDILNLINSESERVSKLYQTELENPLHQTQVDSLNNELNNINEILENMIKTANNNKTQEIQEKKDSISKLNNDISSKIEKLNQEIISENESSVKLIDQAKKDLEDIIEKSKHDDKTTSLELSQNLEKIHIKNDNEIDSTRIKIKQLISKIANDKNTNEIIISSTKSQNEKDLDKAEKNFQKEVHKLQCNLTGLSDFLDEKIQVLEEEVQKLNANFDITKPRECDVEKIEMLEKKLVNTTAFLKSQLQEFMQIKSLIVSRESEYNKRFGSGPKVGTYSMQQTHSAHSQRGLVN